MNFREHLKVQALINKRRCIEYRLEMAAKRAGTGSRWVSTARADVDEDGQQDHQDLPPKMKLVLEALRAAGAKDVRVERVRDGESDEEAIDRVLADEKVPKTKH